MPYSASVAWRLSIVSKICHNIWTLALSGVRCSYSLQLSDSKCLGLIWWLEVPGHPIIGYLHSSSTWRKVSFGWFLLPELPWIPPFSLWLFVLRLPFRHQLLNLSISTYMIIQVILAFWLVLAYDLQPVLEDRCTIDIIITKFFPLCLKMAERFENLDNILRVWVKDKVQKKSWEGTEQPQEAGRRKTKPII